MTERGARSEDDLRAWWEDDNGDQSEWDDAGWDDAGWDDTGWDDAGWDDYVSSRYHPPPVDQPRSAQRSSRLLLSLIVVAAAALVVAVAVLVSGNFAGQIPTNPRLATPTSEPQRVAPTGSTVPGGMSSSSTPSEVPPPVRTTKLESTSETPRPVPSAPTPAASEPAASEPAAGSSERKPASGPRTNVTRTPMSFTPSVRGN